MAASKDDKDQLRPAVPQPTKRDNVIAQRLARAAQGDTPVSIANNNNIPVDELLAANPGVVTVRPGQVLSLPKTGGGYMPSLTPANNQFQTPNYAGYTGTAGYWGQYNQPVTQTTRNNPIPGITQPPALAQTPALTAARNATPTPPQQPYLGASSYLNPAYRPQPSGVSGDKQGVTGSGTTPPPAMFPTDDKGKPIPYTGDPNDPNTKLWKNYWNASAEAGVDLSGRTNAPKVMTRSEIWEMKAAQRRRRSAEQPSYSGGFQYDTTLSPLVRNITWGIRG